MYLNFNSRSWFNRVFGSRPDYFVNAILVDEAEPDKDNWIRIVPVGNFPRHHNGAHSITQQDIEQMAANFNNSGTDLLFDIDHESLWGDTRAAGWSGEVEAREDGLYAQYPNFTPSAKKAIENKEYRYFSPVYFLDKKDKQGDNIGAVIDSVAVTNRPYMDREIDHIGNSFTQSKQDSQSNTEDMKLNKQALETLGLDEDASEEEINEAILNQNAGGSGQEAATGGSGSKQEAAADGSEQEPEEAATANSDLAKKVDSISERLDKWDANNQQQKVTALINAAIDKGKINPADKDAWINSAQADYEGTKKVLSERKENSAMPGKVTVSKEQDDGEKKNATEACADYLRGQMKMSKTGS
jgi:phage I-like protein